MARRTGFPFQNGTICVNENPESTTSAQSGIDPGRSPKMEEMSLYIQSCGAIITMNYALFSLSTLDAYQ